MDNGKLPVGAMKSQSEIKKLAKQKLEAAKCLLENEHYDDAFYLAGYSVELYLKAMICKTLGVDSFFSFDKISKEHYRPFKIHDYEVLLVFSGIYSAFQTAMSEPEFAKTWDVVEKWNENWRYASDLDKGRVKLFVNASEIICSWIQKLL
jgi:hypothetical protein